MTITTSPQELAALRQLQVSLGVRAQQFAQTSQEGDTLFIFPRKEWGFYTAGETVAVSLEDVGNTLSVWLDEQLEHYGASSPEHSPETNANIMALAHENWGKVCFTEPDILDLLLDWLVA